MSTTPPPTPPSPPTPPTAAPTPAAAATPAVPAKKSNTFLWILGGCGGFILLCIILVVAIFYYGMHKAKQAGLDPELMKKNPALATAKMVVFANSDVEMVSSDDDAGTMVVRDKKTGKVTKLKFDMDKKTMVVTDEQGKTASITANTDSGNLEMKGPEGTLKIGANADKAPAWVPVYPGATVQNTMSVNANGTQSGTYIFVTQDASDKVLSSYADALKASGMTASTTSNNTDGKVSGIVSGSDQDHKRTVLVTVSPESDGTHVSVTFEEKKGAS
jgi:hypothetical protein